MKYVSILFFQISSALYIHDPYQVPGNSSITARAPRAAQDCGTFTVDCKDMEHVCNNICYHIRCINPETAMKTYVGSGEKTTRTRNRFDSGNTAATGGAFCRSFPFSQRLIKDQNDAIKWNTDEWPMASCIQKPFDQRTSKDYNSLRCVPGNQNSRQGGRFTNFEHDDGNLDRKKYPGRKGVCAGTLLKGDTYKVEFNIATADQGLLPHCVKLNAKKFNEACDDPFQVRLTSRSTSGGKISSPYDPPVAGDTKAKDTTYAIQYGHKKNILQCSVEFVRSQHFEVEARVVNWDNKDLPKVRENHVGGTYTTTMKGLPYDLVVKSKGEWNSILSFTYGTKATEKDEISYFEWNTDSIGSGAGIDGEVGHAERFCKVVPGKSQYDPRDRTYSLGLKSETLPPKNPSLGEQDTLLVKCIFPCFDTKDI